MSNILFHPKAKVAEIGRIAANEGCRLKAVNGRVLLVKINQCALGSAKKMGVVCAI